MKKLMIYLGCRNCKHFNNRDGDCAAYQKIPLPFVPDELFHTNPAFNQNNDYIYEPKKNYELEFTNLRDYFSKSIHAAIIQDFLLKIQFFVWSFTLEKAFFN